MQYSKHSHWMSTTDLQSHRRHDAHVSIHTHYMLIVLGVSWSVYDFNHSVWVSTHNTNNIQFPSRNHSNKVPVITTLCVSVCGQHMHHHPTIKVSLGSCTPYAHEYMTSTRNIYSVSELSAGKNQFSPSLIYMYVNTTDCTDYMYNN